MLDTAKCLIQRPGVLHVVWALEEGGAPVYQLVLEQRRRGLEADVLVANKGGFYAEKTREAGARVHELRQRRAFDMSVLRHARAILQAYPIVHFHATEPVLIALAAREPHLRLFYTHRAGLHDYSLRKRFRHAIIGHYLRRFDGVTANTRQSAQAAARLFGLAPDSITVVYNGLDFTLLEPRRSREEVLSELRDERGSTTRIGTAAILRRLKRVDRLIHAMAAIRDESVHCYIFGDGPARPELERLASTLQVSDRVTFVGHKRGLGDYLQVLDIFALPSGPAEAFGNAVVEAMAVGIPSVVFVDGGGLTEHIEDRSTGFIVRDQNEFVQTLLQLTRDEALRSDLGVAARESVRRKYTMHAMVAGYDSVYQGVVPRQVSTASPATGERSR